MNRRGFTLVELLATIVILGIMMAIAVPNVINTVNRSRANSYVSDAKKMISLAEYKFRTDPVVIRNKATQNNQCTIMTLKYFDTDEFDNPPNGGTYNVDKSFVAIRAVNDTTKGRSYVYCVNLVEYKNGGAFKEIGIKTLDEINEASSSLELVKSSGFTNISTFTNATINKCGDASCTVKNDAIFNTVS
jgi:prepilin-type N-terminal cleavage/methylation domain-containing protein